MRASFPSPLFFSAGKKQSSMENKPPGPPRKKIIFPRNFWKEPENRRKFFDFLYLHFSSLWDRQQQQQQKTKRSTQQNHQHHHNLLHSSSESDSPLEQFWTFTAGNKKGLLKTISDFENRFTTTTTTTTTTATTNVTTAACLHFDDRITIRVPQDLKQISAAANTILSNYYSNSLHLALLQIYSKEQATPAAAVESDNVDDEDNDEFSGDGEYSFLHHFWKFKKRSPSSQFSWVSRANRRAYFRWLERKLQIQAPEDWYRYSAAALIRQTARLRCSTLLCNYYGSSLLAALRDLYPHVEWLPWRFRGGVERSFWVNPQNRRAFFDWVFKSNAAQDESSVQAPPRQPISREDFWYSVTSKQIESLGGAYLMERRYASSVYRAVSDVYPETEWHPWLFRSSTGVPTGYWRKRAHRRNYLRWLLLHKKNIDPSADPNPQSWASALTLADFKRNKGSFISTFYSNSVTALLVDLYPQFKKQFASSARHKKTQKQRTNNN